MILEGISIEPSPSLERFIREMAIANWNELADTLLQGIVRRSLGKRRVAEALSLIMFHAQEPTRARVAGHPESIASFNAVVGASAKKGSKQPRVREFFVRAQSAPGGGRRRPGRPRKIQERPSEALLEELLRAQGDRCAICKKESDGTKLHLDHCHRTGAVRGFLCGKCNLDIGMLEKWGTEGVASRLEYIANQGSKERALLPISEVRIPMEYFAAGRPRRRVRIPYGAPASPPRN